VEPPEGNSSRLWGDDGARISGSFNMINAGKQGISIDLRADGAQALVLALVKHADVVLENFRPDVMSRLGIGYERSRRRTRSLLCYRFPDSGGTARIAATRLCADRACRVGPDRSRGAAGAASRSTCRCRWPTPMPACMAWSRCCRP